MGAPAFSWVTGVSSLVEKMRDLAPGHPRSSELLEKAYDLEQSLKSQDSEQGMKRMLGCWARARRLYCEISGEPLV